MRWIGALLVACSCFLLGIMQARELKRREDMLVEMKKVLQGFRTGIRFSSRPLQGLILEQDDAKLCSMAAEEKCFFTDPGKALKNAGERLLKAKKDRELWESFAMGLGVSDTQSQLEHIELHSALVDEHLKEAQKERETKSRLYISLGAFAGIALCVLLV